MNLNELKIVKKVMIFFCRSFLLGKLVEDRDFFFLLWSNKLVEVVLIVYIDNILYKKVF